MDEIYDEYETLIAGFVDGKTSAEEFQRAYLDRFKTEVRDLNEPLYQVLEDLFGDVDVFSASSELLEHWPHLYIDGTVLKERAKRALERLKVLQHARPG
jgi:Bacterial self-protective colicin-like immunity